MNRRDALKLTAGLLVNFLLPAPRPRIDLAAFCDPDADPRGLRRYDCRHPWQWNDFVCATDYHVCVRVRPEAGDRVTGEGTMPPFGKLDWDHDRLGRWKAMPAPRPLPAADSECPACRGYGYAGGASTRQCPRCDGMGRYYPDREPWPPQWCRTCNGRGNVPPPGVPVCPNCNGHAIGTFPALVGLGGLFFDAALYRKVQALGAEYAHGGGDNQPTRFRFDGGTGLLMPIRTDDAVRRLKGA